MSERMPFASGEYFRRFRDAFPDLVRNSEQFRKGYEDSFLYLYAHGYPNPLHTSKPKVLQIGSASYTTAKTFVEFIHTQNTQANIFIADLSLYPLQECREQALINSPNIHLVQSDTTRLPFRNNSFHLIETDGLLQFLPNKQVVLSEWFRILRPGGVVTTRDWLMVDHPSEYDLALYDSRKHRYDKLLGTMSYTFKRRDLERLLQATGFIAHSHPVSAVGINKFLHHVVAQKPILEKIG